MTFFPSLVLLPRCIRPIVLCSVIVTLTSVLTLPTSHAQELPWINLTSDSEVSSFWARGITSISADQTEPVVLQLVANGVVTAYVNGQRVVNDRPGQYASSKQAGIEIDVSRLLRKGNNCIAVTVANNTGQLTTAGTAARLVVRGSNALPGASVAWKRTEAAPPVGWQQTDFNDRDWKPADAKQTINLASFPKDAWTAVTIESPTSNERPGNSNGLELLDGDHVVLLGATFIERAQQFGHLEAGLSAAIGSKRVTFRNLGWSADTVWAESRGIFDSPAQGYQRMIEHVRAEEPTVILICYGQNEALQKGDSAAAVNSFRQQLSKLIADVSTTGADIVLLSPTHC